MTLRGIVNGNVSDRTDVDQYLGLFKAGVTGVGTTPQVFDVVNGYGADPTGVTSSSTAIENAQAAAANGAGYVYFPNTGTSTGAYKITRPIVVNRWDRFIGGAGVNNVSLNGTIITYAPQEYNGSANAVVTTTSNTLTDTRASWTPNQWTGYQVVYGDTTVANPGGPFMGTVASNTPTVLTLGDAGGTTAYSWTPTPPGGPATDPVDGQLYYIGKSVFEFATSDGGGASESVIKNINIDGGINGLYSTRGAVQVRLSELGFTHQRFAAICIKGFTQQWYCDHLVGSAPYGFYCNNEVHPTLGIDNDRFLDKNHFYSFFFHGGATAIHWKTKESSNVTFQDVNIDTCARDGLVIDGGTNWFAINNLNTEGNGFDDTSQPDPVGIWGNLAAGSTSVPVTNATGYVTGSRPLTIQGAGGGSGQGFDHYTTITSVAGNTLTIANATTTTVNAQAQNTTGTGVTYPNATTVSDSGASFTQALIGATIFAGVPGSGIKSAIVTALASATSLTISSWAPSGAPAAAQGYVIGPMEVTSYQYSDVVIKNQIANGSVVIREGSLGSSGTGGKLRYGLDGAGAGGGAFLQGSAGARPIYDPLWTILTSHGGQVRRTSTPWSNSVASYQGDTGDTGTAHDFRTTPPPRILASAPAGNLVGWLQDASVNGTSALGNFEWRQSDNGRSVLMTLTSLAAGTNHGLQLAVPIFPGSGTSLDNPQTACGMLAGTGVPSNAIGQNGWYYFRSDGSSATTHIYFKSGGSWAGIA